MSQAAAFAYLTREWQSTPEIYAKAVADDPKQNYHTFRKNLLNLARNGLIEHAWPPRRGLPASWRLRP